MHAARSGHSQFAESTEEIKPLTEEEKIAQRKRFIFFKHVYVCMYLCI